MEPKTKEEAVEYIRNLQDKFGLKRVSASLGDYKAKIDEKQNEFKSMFSNLGVQRCKVVFTINADNFDYEVKRLRGPNRNPRPDKGKARK